MGDDAVEFETAAKVTAKKVGIAPQGTLRLSGGRLTFTVGGRVDLDVAVADISEVRVPWYMLGAGIRFTVGGTKWVADFSKLLPGTSTAVGTAINAFQLTKLGSWRDLAKAWRDVLVRSGAAAA